MKAPGSDLSEIVYVACALDISFYAWRKKRGGGGLGAGMSVGATVAHMARDRMIIRAWASFVHEKLWFWVTALRVLFYSQSVLEMQTRWGGLHGKISNPPHPNPL